MRLLAAGLACLICASASAEDQPDDRMHYACAAVTPQRILKCQSNIGPNAARRFLTADKRYTSAEDFARHARVGDQWWPEGAGPIVATFAASGIQLDSDGFRLRGKAEIHTTTLGIEADELDYHRGTGEIEARGNVRVKPVSSF